jgi:dihydroorotate dehydrogenase (NAD+) catalytic subunit
MTIELAPHHSYGLQLRNPIMVAAGCLGYGIHQPAFTAIGTLGALVTPTTDVYRRNKPIQLQETPSGLLIQGHWPSQRLETVVHSYTPIWAESQTPAILSLAADDLQITLDCIRFLEGIEGIAAIELNCTNHIHVDSIRRFVTTIRSALLLPLLVKLPADLSDLIAAVQQTADAGADALVVGGTMRGQWFRGTTASDGWLCGPAQHAMALRRVAQITGAVSIPVIGGGGICDSAGVNRMLAAGAIAVQLGSVLLRDPGLAGRLV